MQKRNHHFIKFGLKQRSKQTNHWNRLSVVQCAPDISGSIYPKDSRKTTIARRLGRCVVVFREFLGCVQYRVIWHRDISRVRSNIASEFFLSIWLQFYIGIIRDQPGHGRRRYMVMPLLIGWAHTQSHPCIVLQQEFMVLYFKENETYGTVVPHQGHSSVNAKHTYSVRAPETFVLKSASAVSKSGIIYVGCSKSFITIWQTSETYSSLSGVVRHCYEGHVACGCKIWEQMARMI